MKGRRILHTAKLAVETPATVSTTVAAGNRNPPGSTVYCAARGRTTAVLSTHPTSEPPTPWASYPPRKSTENQAGDYDR